MQLSVRAATLRLALERATDASAVVQDTDRGWRISAPVSEDRTIADFRAALRAIQAGDDWGSITSPGTFTVWTEVRSEG